MAYVKDRGVPWHGLGKSVDGIMTGAEALVAAGLDWKVEQEPLFITDPAGGIGAGQLVARYVANVRSTDHSVLGVVGTGYVPFQNEELAAFGDALVDDGGAKYETAGSLWDGRRVFLSMEVPKHIKVPGDSSDHTSYILLVNGHDGSAAVQIVTTIVRAVCHNTVSAAIRGARSKFSARHTRNVEQRVGEARRSLGVVFDYLDSFEKVAGDLARIKLTKKAGNEVLAAVFPLSPEQRKNDEARAKSMLEQAILNWNGSGTIDDAMRRTGWGLYNAVSELTEFGPTFRKEEGRFGSVIEGPAAAARAQTVALLLGK
jgi:phage/plasmid-like protein (TIGR03299 family)